MKLRSKILCSVAIASTLACNSCSHGFFGSPQYLAVTIQPRPASVPAGGTALLTASVSNNLSLPAWTLVNSADAPNVGTLTPVSGSTTSILFTAPPTPPIYTAAAGAGFTQGTVTVAADVAPPPLSTLPVAHDSVTIFITTPNISVGLSPATASIALNGTQLFTGYAIGNVNNKLTWQVNGVTGGSVSAGTIDSQGFYTAPNALPITGNTVTITIISQADPTKTATALVTL